MRRKKGGDNRLANEKRETPCGTDTDEPSASETELELLEQVLERAKSKILSDRNDFSVTDLIRILQARQEMRSETVKEIEVRWVDDTEGNDVGRT